MHETNEQQPKAVVSVAEMSRMVGLSRARFYQLIGTTFPPPLYAEATNRPFYDENLQSVCLDVRRRNCGIDGKPVLFYSRRPATALPMRKPKNPRPPKNDQHADLIDGLKGLGAANVTAAQVAEAVKELYPNGASDVPQGELLRAVFLRLRRRNSGDNVR
jgi:hypothetical protein